MPDRSARVAYAPKGLYGVLTPQANTTVEPELTILTPVGYGFVAARLTSPKPTVEARLVDYFDTLEAKLAQFAGAPLEAVAVACTGSSYLAGAVREAELVEAWQRAAQVPVITTANAVVVALQAIGAHRIGLVSPYDPSLTAASVGYWRSRGLEVVRVATATGDGRGFHSIYTLGHAAADAALDELAGCDLDAVVMLGTGLPTLAPILARGRAGRVPILSSMLALAMVTVAAIDGRTVGAGDVHDWITGRPWGGKARLSAS